MTLKSPESAPSLSGGETLLTVSYKVCMQEIGLLSLNLFSLLLL